MASGFILCILRPCPLGLARLGLGNIRGLILGVAGFLVGLSRSGASILIVGGLLGFVGFRLFILRWLGCFFGLAGLAFQVSFLLSSLCLFGRLLRAFILI